MKTTCIFLLTLISISQIACLNRSGLPMGQVEKRYAKFGVTPPPSPWVKKRFRGADLYFEHPDIGSSIFVNADCEKVKDSPLEALLAQELIGLTDITVEEEDRRMIADREALITLLQAKLDGVPRIIKIMVLKKNRCVFDAVFNAPLNEREHLIDFDRVIESLWAEAEL